MKAPESAENMRVPRGKQRLAVVVIILIALFFVLQPIGSAQSNPQSAGAFDVQWYVIAALALVPLETALIVGMLWLRARRRKVETDLLIANDRLRMALECGRSVGWDWDVKTGRDYWFGDLRSMFGIPSESYVGKVEDFHERVHPEDRERVAKAVSEARKNHTPYTADFRVIHADGIARWVAARGKFYYDTNGGAARMLGMAADITESKQLEATLRESEERFRLVANTAPMMVWMSGVDKLCSYFNQTWLDFTGRSLEEELGNGWAVGVHPEDYEICLETYSKAFDERRSFQMEYRIRRHDGQYRWIFDVGVPRFHDDGSFVGYIGSAMDVTDRKVAEETLSMVSRKLIQAQEEERAWIARELHDDICQRLIALMLNLEAAKKRNTILQPELKEGIDKCILQASKLSSDMQALSHRLHSSKLEYLGLRNAVSAYCNEVSYQYQVQIELHADPMPSDLPAETCLCTFRVLQEALQNAVKHSQSTRFEVSLRFRAGEIALVVRDWGIGFDPSEAIKGRGLGLTSMRERLKLVNGELSVESQDKNGTTIHARIRLTAKARSAQAAG